MYLTHLAAFHAVAGAGSMTGAAERLQVSQPAVSKQVKELEHALGVLLFDRVGRGLRLTQAGELLAGYARRLFALEAEAERAVAELRAVGSGRLVIGASLTVGSYLLPGVLAAFRRRYPGVRLHVEIANTERVHRMLLDFALDVGLTEGFVEEEGLHAEVFATDELLVIAAPGHPLLRKRRVTARDLDGAAFVLREPGSGTRAVEERALAQIGVRVEPVMTLGSAEAINRVVAEGVGLAFASRLAVADDLACGRLAVLPVADLALKRQLHLVRLRDRQDGPTLRAFRAVLRATLSG